MWYNFRPYVPVAQRKAEAAREVANRRKKGETITPVVIAGKKIVTTFWGQAWCDNLEAYSDFANRLPRGRTYVRNGSVVNLQIKPGKIEALVSGSEIYEIDIDIDPLADKQWASIKQRCAGQIGSLVELLQGKLSKGVIEIITAKGEGLFPRPREIHMECSCPDWAGMCKHIAAVMYGVGARMDLDPALFFLLRKVDQAELIEEALERVGPKKNSEKKRLADADVADVFGIELAGEDAAAPIAKKNRTKKPKLATTEAVAPTPKPKTTRARKTKKKDAES